MNKTDVEIQKTMNNFVFSAVEIENLEGSQYTLVSILIDLSSSVDLFSDELEQTITTVINSCKKSPQAENLLVRVAGFTDNAVDNIEEFHGFINVSSITDDQYKGSINPNGMTPLYDATGSALESIETYGKQLNDQDYDCNGIVFVITDGAENCSRKIKNASEIKNIIDRIRVNEQLESIQSYLIGVNDSNSYVKDHLNKFETEGGFDQFISLGDVSIDKLTKLANWISQSISSQSQSLTSGGPSKATQFTL